MLGGRRLGMGGRRAVDGELRSLSSNERHEAGLRRLEVADRRLRLRTAAGRRGDGASHPAPAVLPPARPRMNCGLVCETCQGMLKNPGRAGR
jgi:hypothetical protein